MEEWLSYGDGRGFIECHSGHVGRFVVPCVWFGGFGIQVYPILCLRENSFNLIVLGVEKVYFYLAVPTGAFS